MIVQQFAFDSLAIERRNRYSLLANDESVIEPGFSACVAASVAPPPVAMAGILLAPIENSHKRATLAVIVFAKVIVTVLLVAKVEAGLKYYVEIVAPSAATPA